MGRVSYVRLDHETDQTSLKHQPAVRNGMIHPWSKVSFQIVKAATAAYLNVWPTTEDTPMDTQILTHKEAERLG